MHSQFLQSIDIPVKLKAPVFDALDILHAFAFATGVG